MEYFTIPNLPMFEITRLGIIRNKANLRIKKQYIGSTGYYMISVSSNNKSKPYRVHQLIARTFISNPMEHQIINHKNGIKTDNSIDNLEWCTQQYNCKHALDTGLVNNQGINNGQAVLTESLVKEIKALINLGLSQYKISKAYGVSRSCVLGIKLGRLWRHVIYTELDKDYYEAAIKRFKEHVQAHPKLFTPKQLTNIQLTLD